MKYVLIVLIMGSWNGDVERKELGYYSDMKTCQEVAAKLQVVWVYKSFICAEVKP